MSCAYSYTLIPMTSPKRIYYIGSIPLVFMNYLRTEIGTQAVSEPVTFEYFDDTFTYFVLKKIGAAAHVSILRTRKDPTAKPDFGYTLRFEFSAIAYNQEAKQIVEIPANNDRACAEFWLVFPSDIIIPDYLNEYSTVEIPADVENPADVVPAGVENPADAAGVENPAVAAGVENPAAAYPADAVPAAAYPAQFGSSAEMTSHFAKLCTNDDVLFRVVIKLVEYDYLNEKNKDTIQTVTTDSKNVNNMVYLLKQPPEEPLFTGRLNDRFAERRKTVILRASRFARDFSYYWFAREKGEVSEEQSEAMRMGIEEVFESENYVKMLAEAEQLGIDLLKHLVMDCIFYRMQKEETFVRHVIYNSDYICCKEFIDQAEDYFLINFKQLTDSPIWIEIVHQSIIGRFYLGPVLTKFAIQELSLDTGGQQIP